MEYPGFISDVICRSKILMDIGHKKNLNVTSLLMLLCAGFVMPYERLKYWSDNDPGLKRSATHKKIKKLAEKIHLRDKAMAIPNPELSNFDIQNWKLYKDEVNDFNGLNFRHDILPRILDGSIKESAESSLASVMRIMRNAFSHAGVHPISPYQIDELASKNGLPRSRVQASREIETIYLVSRTDAEKGFFVIKVPTLELEAFWNWWRELLLEDLGEDGIAELDKAA